MAGRHAAQANVKSWTIYLDYVGGVQQTMLTTNPQEVYKYRSSGYRVEQN